MAPPLAARRRRLSGPILWVALCLAVGSIVVLTTKNGLDILALVLAAFVLLLIERTVGDWLAETIGPAPGALVFVIVAAAGFLYVTSEQGQSQVDALFQAAADRGYHASYFGVERAHRRLLAIASRRPAGSVPAGSGLPPTALPSAIGTAGRSIAQPASGVAIARLRIEPEVATPGQPVVFRADLSAERPGTLPAVEFSVNGRVIATRTPDATGVAEAPWRTAVPGQYVVRARIPGRLFDVALASSMLTVLPGRR